MNAHYTGPLPTHGRFDYEPISRRAPYRWPGGAGLAVYLGLNIELQLARIRQPRRRLALPGTL